MVTLRKKTTINAHYFVMIQVDVSENSGFSPQIIHLFIGFSIIFTIHFGLPLFFGNTHIYIYIYNIYIYKSLCIQRSERQMMSVWGVESPPETHGILGNTYIPYPPVNKHSNGKSPSWIGNESPNGGFSIAMLDYRRVHLHLDAVSVSPKLTQVSRTWRNTLEAGPQQLVASNLKVWELGRWIYIYIIFTYIYIFLNRIGSMYCVFTYI